MSRLGQVGALLPTLVLTACATTNSARAPDADLHKLKTFYVARLPADERGVEKLIANRLTVMGYQFMTVKMEVSYTLVDTTSGKTVWAKNIASEHTAKPSEAFAGVTRLRLANEGAAKDNIQQALTELSSMQL